MIVLRMAGLFVLSMVLLLATAWVCGALWYQLPVSRGWRIAALVAWALLGLATLVLCWRHQGMRALPAYAVAFTVVLGWWAGIQPTGRGDWADDVARQTRATVQDRFITFDQVRDFEWRSETDYTVRWKTARYDLDTVETVDVATSYWMGPAIAHTLVSFGFRDGRYLTFSIEIRKRRGEAFSSIAGFFKHFEATLVAAEESDILRTRTHARGEDVYLYRVGMSPDARRSLLLAYADEANLLAAEPRFYNTLTANCTTIVYQMAERIVPGLPLDYRLLLSGLLPQYLYDIGALDTGRPFEEVRTAARITQRAQSAPSGPAFSAAIRAGQGAR